MKEPITFDSLEMELFWDKVIEYQKENSAPKEKAFEFKKQLEETLNDLDKKKFNEFLLDYHMYLMVACRKAALNIFNVGVKIGKDSKD